LDEEWTLRLKMKEKGRWWRDAGRGGGGGGGGLEDGESGYGEKKRKKRRSHGRRVEMGNK